MTNNTDTRAPGLEGLTRWEHDYGSMEQDQRGEYVKLADVEHLLAQAAQVAAPEGWKLIPIKPTQEMLRAAWDKANDAGELLEPSDAYRTMLAASPAPPAPQLRMQEVRADVERWAASHAALLAECRAVFDLMLEGCALQEFADYQNGDGETIGPRMDALHAKLRALVSHAGASAVLVHIPQTADEIIAFIGSHYDTMEQRDDDTETRFQLSVHDLQSAFRWWFEDYVTEVATPSTAAVRAAEWQPIETAPKDGTEVLLYLGPHYSRVVKARWFDLWENWIEGEFPDAQDEYCGIGSRVPTHWLPLPAAPIPAADGGNGGEG